MKAILYTTEEGGDYKFTQAGSDAETISMFNHLKETGEIALKTGDAEPVPQKLAFIMLLNELDHWDFVLAKFPAQNGNGKRY